jgi:predicted nucleic acid-binding protein
VDAHGEREVARPHPTPVNSGNGENCLGVFDSLSALDLHRDEDFVVDSIVLGELSFGILALPKGRKRVQLEEWFNAVVSAIECLPWDAAVSLRWARLVVDLKKKGTTLPVLDTMIAATALEHDLTVVTRNVRDFKRTGVKVLNPFA